MLWAQLSHGGAGLIKDEPGKGMGQIGQSQLCFSPGQPEGAYEQTEATLLIGENVLDANPD